MLARYHPDTYVRAARLDDATLKHCPLKSANSAPIHVRLEDQVGLCDADPSVFVRPSVRS